MFGYYSAKVETCPNCGDKSWDPKAKKPECQKCGYTKVETKQLDPITLTYCEGCGCHRTDVCTLHPTDKQKKVKL